MGNLAQQRFLNRGGASFSKPVKMPPCSTTVLFREVEIDVDYHYQPEERASRDSAGSGEEIELVAIYVRGVDIQELLDEEALDQVAGLIARQIADEERRAA